MTHSLTFAMIKPDAVAAKYTGPIIDMIEQAGFDIRALKLTTLAINDASLFYRVHKDRPFYTSMCRSIARGPIVAMVLEKENAVVDFRKLIGATDPAEAEVGTIRARFGKSIEANAIHGSDAHETATAEMGHFFPYLELTSFLLRK